MILRKSFKRQKIKQTKISKMLTNVLCSGRRKKSSRNFIVKVFVNIFNKRTFLYIYLAVILWPLKANSAKTYLKSQNFNTVRHHYHTKQLQQQQQELVLSRQPRQQRETGFNGVVAEKGYCAPYNGKICKNFISHQVWYSREDPTGGWKNEQITTALWEELIGDLNGLCRSAAEVRNFKEVFYIPCY